MKRARHKNAYIILIRKPEVVIPVGSRSGRWQYSMKVKYGMRIVNWIHVAQDRDLWRAVVETVMYLVP
jgi:hypothetical protein